MFRVHGWYLPKELVLEALHSDGTDTEVWALVSAKLNSSKVLLTRVHWKPNLAQQLKVESRERVNEMNNAIKYGYNQVSSALRTEADERQRMMSVPDMSLTTNAIQQEASSFRRDYQMTMDGLEEMMNNNEFYLRDVADTASETGRAISERTRVVKYQLRRLWDDYRRSLKQRLGNFRRSLDQIMAKLEERIAAIVLKFRPAWQSYAYSVIRSVQNTQQSLAHNWEKFTEKMTTNNAAISRFFDDRFDFISYRLQPFWEKWTSMPDNIFAAQERNFFGCLQEKLEIWVAKIRERWDEVNARLQDKLQIVRAAIQVKMDQVMDTLMEYRLARIMINYTKQVYYHMVDVWEAWEMPETLVNLTRTMYHEMKAFARDYLTRTVKKYMRMENSGFTVYDPENGEIRAAIFLPLEVEQFNKMPKLDLGAFKLAVNRIKDRLVDGDYSIWDTYYKYKPSSNPRHWIPPFEAHAMLAHGKHYTTFDGVTYDFASAGTCSYILARDFIDGNFTVVANYRSSRIHSIMVMSDGQNIEIYDDFKVTVDDHRRELPLEYQNTTVTRSGYKIRVHNEQGFTVTCDLHNKICTTNITGWYYGKTAGLLGTYNNEQDDDFLMSNRRTTNNLNEFTQSWEIGNECPGSRNTVRQVTEVTNPEITQICDSYFKEKNSIYRPCFKQVDPEPLRKSCVNDLSESSNHRMSLKERACSVGAIYRAQCELVSVHLPQDSQCISCTNPDGSEEEYRGAVTVENMREKRADIVLVVEEKPCNRDVVNRLENIVNIIDSSLKRKGVRDNRFAVLGFGGRGVHDPVNVHTMEGQIFNEARKIRSAIRTLDFTAAGDNTDVLAAVYDATKLTYRAGASKSIVVIPCSDCTAQSINYAALQQILSENAMNLHVMAEHDFALRINSPKTNYLFGIDNSAAYTMYHLSQQQLQGDVHLHRQVVMPKSLCSALALSQNGSMFNVQKLTEGRTKTQKSFVDIFARRVAKTAMPLDCQVCECSMDRDGASKSVCRSCAMPSYNNFFKKFFPTLYRYEPTEAFEGSSKAEQIPLPIPRSFSYQEQPGRS